MAGGATWRQRHLPSGGAADGSFASGHAVGARPFNRMARLLSVFAPQATAQSAGSATPAPPPAAAAAASGYRLPPKEIAEIVDAPPEPLLSFSPDRSLVLQLSRPPPNMPISELARPELKLAGKLRAAATRIQAHRPRTARPWLLHSA
jgi:hypothetical protein